MSNGTKEPVDNRRYTGKRYTCRNQFGQARLIPGVNLMDLVEDLCKVEENRYGPMAVDAGGVTIDMELHCRGCQHFMPKSFGSGLCAIHIAVDKTGATVGPNRVVSAARRACPDYLEVEG